MAEIWLLAAATGFATSGIACSDPVPAASQAAAVVRLTNISATGSGNCPAQQQLIIPDTGKPTDVLTSDRWGKLATDGQDSAKVTCVVKQNGSGFRVRGSVAIPKSVSAQNWGSVAIQIESAAEGQSDAKGALMLTSQRTGGAAYESSECTFSVLKVAAGRFWAQVVCPLLADPTFVGGQTCQVDTSPASYVLFQNCDQ